LPAGSSTKTLNKRGQQTYTRGQRVYRRRLGDAKADQAPGWFGTWTAGDDVALEAGMYRVYHFGC
jgi:hypothetical protein